MKARGFGFSEFTVTPVGYVEDVGKALGDALFLRGHGAAQVDLDIALGEEDMVDDPWGGCDLLDFLQPAVGTFKGVLNTAKMVVAPRTL